MSTPIDIPIWLLVLLGILVSLGIISIIYWMFTQRRIAIVAKKVDYLVEDLIYKSELLSSTVESIVKFSNLADSIEAVMNGNQTKLVEIISKNKKLIKSITDDMNSLFKKDENLGKTKK